MMKTELEYVHDSKNSKVWSIELKGKEITILYGKKNSTLNETLLNYSSEKEAKLDYSKRISEKLKKGYQNISTSNKKSKSKSKSKSESKNIKSNTESGLQIQTISPYAKDLLNFTNVIQEKYNEYLNNMKSSDDNDDEINEKMTKYYNKHFVKFEKVINKHQTKKIGSFLQSGVVVKRIPAKLTSDVLECVESFSAKTNIDYHPNSDDKVRDIVHPSIYPLLVKTAKSKTQMDFWKRPYEESEFQWLPSEFEIDSNGKCKIKSYINNLPVTETNMYNQIEKLFDFVLPELEDVWSFTNSIQLDTIYNWNQTKQIKENLQNHKLKDRTLQVITKIVTIGLDSKQDLIGAWHIEGMPHENIVATASCTLQQDSNFEGTLSFKRIYTLQEEEYVRLNIAQNPISEIYNLVNNTHVPIGKVDLKPNTLIVFPNSHVHKVDMFNTSSKKQSRTIVVFWLINPEIKIKSTKDIKQQNYPLKIAHENRLKLMKERTFHKQTFNQRDINLCEH